jgi:hypothetical protein
MPKEYKDCDVELIIIMNELQNTRELERRFTIFRFILNRIIKINTAMDLAIGLLRKSIMRDA